MYCVSVAACAALGLMITHGMLSVQCEALKALQPVGQHVQEQT